MLVQLDLDGRDSCQMPQNGQDIPRMAGTIPERLGQSRNFSSCNVQKFSQTMGLELQTASVVQGETHRAPLGTLERNTDFQTPCGYYGCGQKVDVVT